jgi:hypothetical protein
MYERGLNGQKALDTTAVVTDAATSSLGAKIDGAAESSIASTGVRKFTTTLTGLIKDVFTRSADKQTGAGQQPSQNGQLANQQQQEQQRQQQQAQPQQQHLPPPPPLLQERSGGMLNLITILVGRNEHCVYLSDSEAS